MKEIGIYVHIPFCKRKCFYCDFVSYDNKRERIRQYIDTVIEEIEDTASSFTKEHIVNTIYFGGGTPSLLDSRYIKTVLEVLRKNFNISSGVEITLELNPGTIDEEKLKTYQMCGINRLSIGLQTSNDRLLESIGRIHTYSEFLSAYNLSRRMGFNNINVDLMFGLPNETLEDVKKDVENIIELNPEHISTYSLIVEEGTLLEKMLKDSEEKAKIIEIEAIKENKDISNGFKLPDEDTEREMYWFINEVLEKNGYRQYEISNFSKIGYESRHNTDTWRQKEYLGFGAAAHGYLDGIRYSNKKILSEYMFSFRGKNIEEKLDREKLAKEHMMLGLRMIDGVSISEFERKFSFNPLVYFRFEISKLVDEGLLEIDLDSIKLTKKGIDLANCVWREFV